MKLRKQLLSCVMVLSIAFPGVANSMMAVESSLIKGAAGVEPIETQSRQNNKNSVFLLSWKDNILHTTKGALSTLGIKINDHAKVDKEKLPILKNPPRLEFVIENNRVVQVDIYPAR